MSSRQWTIQWEFPSHVEVVTGLTWRQVVKQLGVKELPEAVSVKVEERTEANDPMQWGP